MPGGRKPLRTDIGLTLLIVALIGVTGGCMSARSASAIADNAGFQPIFVPSEPFCLQGYVRRSTGGNILRIYIEGDGQSWRTRTQVSNDPTPKNPLALQLAADDPSTDTVLYIARPCQFIRNPACTPTVWTDGRFSNDVIKSFEEMLDFAQERFEAKRIVLIGYSGGGVIAMLLAAKRSDVDLVITVAAPLDHAAWTSLHGVSPLVASLNPIDFGRELRNVRQVHYVGSDDKIVPPSIVQGFLRKIDDPPDASVTILSKFTHRCCWHREWQRLISNLGN